MLYRVGYMNGFFVIKLSFSQRSMSIFIVLIFSLFISHLGILVLDSFIKPSYNFLFSLNWELNKQVSFHNVHFM